ncbi:hypothetical protein N7450_009898 [Penicillium hetheringtonii]|uniref:Uncharacterized protein n=1 Tax=Penicillium hetheringtonii TaxID=911720 RepID=A0AAD6GMS7_9EURO|nr:hypothetical protein N7450_009898 [Penicillium hetheringtonii]
MPLIPKSGDENLKFDIAAPSDWTFTAGDTIIGNVVRYAPIIAPDAKLSLALVGRSRIHPELGGEYAHTCFLVYQEQKGLFRDLYTTRRVVTRRLTGLFLFKFRINLIKP